jgi:hypothetical protein
MVVLFTLLLSHGTGIGHSFTAGLMRCDQDHQLLVHSSFTGHQFIFISQFHSLLLLSSIRNVQKMWFRAADKHGEALNFYMDCYSRAGQIAKKMH